MKRRTRTLSISYSEAALRDRKRRVGGVATALLSRDGGVLFSELLASVASEVFAIVCATILGVAVTASSAGPRRILSSSREPARGQ